MILRLELFLVYTLLFKKTSNSLFSYPRLYYNGSKKRKYYVSCKIDTYDFSVSLTGTNFIKFKAFQ